MMTVEEFKSYVDPKVFEVLAGRDTATLEKILEEAEIYMRELAPSAPSSFFKKLVVLETLKRLFLRQGQLGEARQITEALAHELSVLNMSASVLEKVVYTSSDPRIFTDEEKAKW
ncbi:MAG: hypothetical protein QW512_03510 [Thermofilaceae archaeon]